jgi:hypothetical protein
MIRQPRTQRAALLEASSLPRPSRAARIVWFRLPFINFNSKWFQSYCRAVLESDSGLANIYIQDALVVINERLSELDVHEDERDAIDIATRYLNLIETKNQIEKAS